MNMETKLFFEGGGGGINNQKWNRTRYVFTYWAISYSPGPGPSWGLNSLRLPVKFPKCTPLYFLEESVTSWKLNKQR